MLVTCNPEPDATYFAVLSAKSAWWILPIIILNLLAHEVTPHLPSVTLITGVFYMVGHDPLVGSALKKKKKEEVISESIKYECA